MTGPDIIGPMRAAIVLLLLLSVMACGQKGALFLPDEPEPATPEAEAGTEDDDGDEEDNGDRRL